MRRIVPLLNGSVISGAAVRPQEDFSVPERLYQHFSGKDRDKGVRSWISTTQVSARSGNWLHFLSARIGEI
jgi:hypothetical protein